jgi:hypothetical protein
MEADPTARRASYDEARRNMRGNPHSRWFVESSDGPASADDPRLAVARIRRGFARIQAAPRLPVGQRTFFMLGSCFARVIELELRNMGLPVPAVDWLFLDSRPDLFPLLKRGEPSAHSFTNRYNLPSMLQEVRILAGGAPPDPDWLLFGHDGNWTDLHYANVVAAASHEVCRGRRELVRERQAAAFSEANTFILTLGLCEAWFDTRSQAYLNTAPPPRAATAERQRFEHEFLGYERNLQALEEICAIIRASRGNDDFEIILTVSPIPLNATFTKLDIVVANAEAKAVLRAVAGEAARRIARVTYFPAFEIALNSEQSLTWMEDGLHVQRPLANHIAGTFLGTLAPRADVPAAGPA